MENFWRFAREDKELLGGGGGVVKQILVDPDKFLGAPYIEGTSLPVSTVLHLAEAGLGPEDISAAYPELTVEDVKAVLSYHP